jgi:hypothetical protein
MGHLSEAAFADLLAPCTGCGGIRYQLASIIDQRQPVMLGDAAGAARWVHDGEKFVDGTHRATCAGCGKIAFASDDCPRCHAAGALPSALRASSRLSVPATCPGCGDNQLVVTALVPALTLYAGGPAQPRAQTELGDPGHHVVAVACEACEWSEHAGDACPLCGAPGPLRDRP